MSAASDLPLRICFVAPNALPLLAPALAEGCPFGGAEVQQVAIGRGLAARGFDVSFVTRAPRSRMPEAVDGVRLIPTFQAERGVRGVRYFYPRAWTLWRALRRADADVYYQRSAGDVTAHVVAFCRLHGRASVFAVANDRDVDPRRMRGRRRLDRALSRWGVRRADHVIVQTRDQQRELRRHFGREGRLMRSLLGFAASGRAAPSAGREILFVGNFAPKKRPELFVALAGRLPHLAFVMAGADGDARTACRVRRWAAGTPNLKIAGRLDRAELGEHYGRALALVNTSSDEGFPNAFLEAWAHEVPVLSLGCDPDGLLSERGLGVVCVDVDELALQLARLAGEPRRAAETGRKARAYVLAHHSPRAVLDGYAEFLHGIAARRRRNPEQSSLPGSARSSRAVANRETWS